MHGKRPPQKRHTPDPKIRGSNGRWRWIATRVTEQQGPSLIQEGKNSLNEDGDIKRMEVGDHKAPWELGRTNKGQMTKGSFMSSVT